MRVKALEFLMFVYEIAQEGDVCLLSLIPCTFETNQIVNLDKNSPAPPLGVSILHGVLHSTGSVTNKYGLNLFDLFPTFLFAPMILSRSAYF